MDAYPKLENYKVLQRTILSEQSKEQFNTNPSLYYLLPIFWNSSTSSIALMRVYGYARGEILK